MIIFKFILKFLIAYIITSTIVLGLIFIIKADVGISNFIGGAVCFYIIENLDNIMAKINNP